MGKVIGKAPPPRGNKKRKQNKLKNVSYKTH